MYVELHSYKCGGVLRWTVPVVSLWGTEMWQVVRSAPGPWREKRETPPKSLSSLTTAPFDLIQCKHCVCMRWREQAKDGLAGCFASAKGNPLSFSSATWTSHSHSTKRTVNMCAHKQWMKIERGSLILHTSVRMLNVTSVLSVAWSTFDVLRGIWVLRNVWWYGVVILHISEPNSDENVLGWL